MTRPGLIPLVIRARAMTHNIALWLIVIAVATLLPSPGSDPGLPRCLICGERGGADAIANLLLFFPLGYALAQRPSARTHARYTRLVFPLAISLAVEIIQIAIPGRNPSVSDIVFNTLGGLLGYQAAARRLRRAQPKLCDRRRWLTYTGTAVLIMALTALLVAPAPTDGIYYGQWTAEFNHLRYGGQVLEAFVDDEAIAHARAMPPARIRRQLVNGASIRVLALAGPSPDGPAALFSLADHRGAFNFFIGIDHDDVVFEYRTRANALRLDQLQLRARHLVRGVRPGDTLRFELVQRPSGVSFRLNGAEVSPRIPNLAMGWQLLFGSTDFPPWLESWLNVAWIVVCLAPIGYASTDERRLIAAGALLIVLLVGLPAASWLAPSPLLAYLAAFAALVLGSQFQGEP